MSSRSGPDGASQVYGVLGHPVGQSLSPAMHNAAFADLGLNAVYVPFPVAPERLEGAVQGLAAAGVRGFNLTIPHKTAIVPLLSEILPEALSIGAVNTVRQDGGRLTGTNTDGAGFLLSLQYDLDFNPAGQEVLLLGAGGAARGIAFAVLGAGAKRLVIANRTAERAVALASDCRTRFPNSAVETAPLESLEGLAPHLLVNATTLGMGDGKLPAHPGPVGVRGAVIDIVYHPLETPLLAEARALGLARSNGIGMLLYQGALAFQFWTGREAPLEVMRAALLEGVRKKGL